MGYNTIFIGKMKINGEVTPELVTYINKFCDTRRMKRSNEKIKEIYPNWRDYCFNGELGTDGEYFAVPAGWNGEKCVIDCIPNKEIDKEDRSILDYNKPPSTQPSLWCHWKIVEENGSYYIKWNGTEKFYYSWTWIDYILQNFLIPNGLSLTGVILGMGDDIEDVFFLTCKGENFEGYSLDEGTTVQEYLGELKELCKDEYYHSSIDYILSFMDDINALLSPDIDGVLYWELFEKFGQDY